MQGLHTAGCTALGPALAVSVALASDRLTSSEIILCTDGVPNTGVGSLSGRRDVTGFYNTVSIYLYVMGHMIIRMLYRLGSMPEVVMSLFPYLVLMGTHSVVCLLSARRHPLLVAPSTFFTHWRWCDRYGALLRMSSLRLKWKCE